MPKFTIILQSFLGEYPGCARDRDIKFARAVDSVLSQTFTDWELIVIADGCNDTFDIIENNYKDSRITCYLIKKQPLWSGSARDLGKLEAKGDYCLYLDSDDLYSKDHLQIINDQLGSEDWVWYNDFIHNGKEWKERECNIKRIGMNGTSNVCFKRELEVVWSGYTGYAHDYYFNVQLFKNYPNNKKINTPGYYVCHLPPHPGGYGYDI